MSDSDPRPKHQYPTLFSGQVQSNGDLPGPVSNFIFLWKLSVLTEIEEPTEVQYPTLFCEYKFVLCAR